jgi:hypothetical protein
MFRQGDQSLAHPGSRLVAKLRMTKKGLDRTKMIRLLNNEAGITLQGLTGVWLATFTDGVIGPIIAALIIINLILAVVIKVRKLGWK